MLRNMIPRYRILMDNEPETSGGGTGYEAAAGDAATSTSGGETQDSGSDSFYKTDEEYEGKSVGTQQEGAQSKEDPSVQGAPKTEAGDEKTPDTEEDIEDLSGYLKEPKTEKEETKKEETKKEESDYSKLDASKVGDTLKDKILEYAKVNKLSPEAAQAIIDVKAADVKALAKYQEEYQATVKSWGEELKNDVGFGGVGGKDFAANVHLNNKFIKENLPNFYNHLTKNPEVQPPYIMRDINALAKKFYETGKFVQGHSATTEENTPWDHYKV